MLFKKSSIPPGVISFPSITTLKSLSDLTFFITFSSSFFGLCSQLRFTSLVCSFYTFLANGKVLSLNALIILFLVSNRFSAFFKTYFLFLFYNYLMDHTFLNSLIIFPFQLALLMHLLLKFCH